MHQVISAETLQENEVISWTAFHANSQIAESPQDKKFISHTLLLPLFHGGSCYSLDQPLYALAKQIQWSWPTTLGEEHYIVMFGGVHIEMVVLKILGDLLEDSGWTGALVLLPVEQ